MKDINKVILELLERSCAINEWLLCNEGREPNKEELARAIAYVRHAPARSPDEYLLERIAELEDELAELKSRLTCSQSE